MLPVTVSLEDSAVLQSAETVDKPWMPLPKERSPDAPINLTAFQRPDGIAFWPANYIGELE